MKRFHTLERSPRLPAEIVASLSEAIANGELRPGDRLPPEQTLAAEFGVARTVVREAISQLKGDGVIQSRQGVGAFVAQPEERTAFRIGPACFAQRQELLKILQLRTSVVAEAAALAAQNRNEGELARMERALGAMRAAQADADGGAERRVDAEHELYRAVAEASGNSYFVDFIALLHGQIRDRLRSVAVKNARAAEWGEAVLAEHEAVVRAIALQDLAKARDAARHHFEAAANRLARRGNFADV